MKTRWLGLYDFWILLRDDVPHRCDRCGGLFEYERAAVAPRPKCKCPNPGEQADELEAALSDEEAVHQETLAMLDSLKAENERLRNELVVLRIKHEGLDQNECQIGHWYFIAVPTRVSESGFQKVQMTDRRDPAGDRVIKHENGTHRYSGGYLQRFFPVETQAEKQGDE